jgi:hypothetical protein
VGRVGRYDRAAAPYMRVGTRSGAFNGRRRAGGMAPQVDDADVTPAWRSRTVCRRGDGRHKQIFTALLETCDSELAPSYAFRTL